MSGAATKSAGWGNPDRARKWHFFRAGESSSACGRWTWGWPRSDLPFARRCKRCERAAKEADR